jgi:hypothetical protein
MLMTPRERIWVVFQIHVSLAQASTLARGPSTRLARSRPNVPTSTVRARQGGGDLAFACGGRGCCYLEKYPLP